MKVCIKWSRHSTANFLLYKFSDKFQLKKGTEQSLVPDSCNKPASVHGTVTVPDILVHVSFFRLIWGIPALTSFTEHGGCCLHVAVNGEKSRSTSSMQCDVWEVLLFYFQNLKENCRDCQNALLFLSFHHLFPTHNQNIILLLPCS